jgi:DHA1 family bicyclomycin/chloramphenicol resistance-like MFS transporter
LLLGGYSIMGPAAIDMVLPALSDLARDLDASPPATHVTVAPVFLGLAVGQLIAGPISDTLGRRTPLLLGAAVFAVSALGCAVVSAQSVFASLRFTQGLAGAVGIVIVRAILRDTYDWQRLPRELARLFIVISLAVVLAPLISVELLRIANWRGAFLFLSVFGAVLLAVGAIKLPETHLPAVRSGYSMSGHARMLREPLRTRSFSGYVLTVGLASGAVVACVAGASVAIRLAHGTSPGFYAVLFSSGALGMVAVGIANHFLLRFLRPQLLLLSGLIGSVIGTSAFLLLGNQYLALFCASVVLVFSTWGFTANAIALALRDHRDIAGSASALVGFAQHATAAVALFLISIFPDDSARSIGILSFTLAMAGGTAGFLTVRTDRGRAMDRRGSGGAPSASPI